MFFRTWGYALLPQQRVENFKFRINQASAVCLAVLVFKSARCNRTLNWNHSQTGRKNADSNSPRCLFFFYLASVQHCFVCAAFQPEVTETKRVADGQSHKWTSVRRSELDQNKGLSVCQDEPLTCDCCRQKLAGCARQLLDDDLSDLAASYALRSRFRLNIHPLTP